LANYGTEAKPNQTMAAVSMHDLDATRRALAFNIATRVRALDVSGSHDFHAHCNCMTYTLAQWVAGS